jgi:hypothetical protein
MLTLSDDNVPSPELRFIMPADSAVIHSSSDPTLPDPGGAIAWPIHDGRDFSRYSEWRQPLGLFAAPATASFVGAYDPTSEQGIVRIFPHASVPGVKLFCLGNLDPALWTDDSSRYFELWGGITPTFWDTNILQPGASVLWTERWYAVSDMGGYNWANAEAAIKLSPEGDRATIAVVTTRMVDATVVAWRGGREVQRWDSRLAPGRPLLVTTDPSALSGDWTVQVVERGAVIAQMGP